MITAKEARTNALMNKYPYDTRRIHSAIDTAVREGEFDVRCKLDPAIKEGYEADAKAQQFVAYLQSLGYGVIFSLDSLPLEEWDDVPEPQLYPARKWIVTLTISWD